VDVKRAIEGLFGHSDVPMEGVVHPEFVGVAQTFSRLLRFYKGGAAVSVYHRGECVVDIWGGARDRAGNPWLRDTMAPSFSTTKGVASTLIHIMADRELLDYDTRVAHYWPEFGHAGKQEITLRQILAHQSGLYHIRQMIDHADRMLDWDYMVHAIEEAAPVHEPGKRTGYHGLTYGFLVGEILQRVTGRSFSELVRQELVEPLDLDGMYVGTPDAELHRAAELIWPGNGTLTRTPELAARLTRLGDLAHSAAGGLREVASLAGFDLDLGSILDALAPRGISGFDFGGDESLRVTIPAANGLFTARSLARMYAMLAAGGELDGQRLISARTVERAAERQVRAPGLAVLPFDMRWRLGYHGIATTAGFAPSAFGHFGFGGSGGWADPASGLALAFIVNCGMGTPFGDTRTARISGSALRSVRRRHRHDEGAPDQRRAERAEPIGASAA
jgi:CubicO group peptidase (beta-lactamase class C family)